MRSDFSPSGDGRPPNRSTPSSAGQVHPVSSEPEEEAKRRDQRISLWNSAVAPFYFEYSRELSVASRAVASSQQLPSKVGAILSHAGAFVSAKLFLTTLAEQIRSPHRSPLEQDALLAARAVTAAAFGSYIAKQGFLGQIAEPLRMVQEVLPSVDRRARLEVLLSTVDALVALPVAPSIDAHPGEILLNECLNESWSSPTEATRQASQVRLLKAYARARCVDTAAELARRWEGPSRQDLLPALGELVASASRGKKNESAISIASLQARALFPSASLPNLLSWAEASLAAGRTDLASLALTTALPCLASAGGEDRLRGLGMQLAVRALDGQGIVFEDGIVCSADERVAALVCAAQFVLALERPAEATELIHRIKVERSPTGNTSSGHTVESCSAVARLAVWAALRRENDALVKELFALASETEGTEEAQARDSYVLSCWLRGMIESLSSPGSGRALQYFYRGAGLRDEALASGSITHVRSLELSGLGARLASACGEVEASMSLFAASSAGFSPLNGETDALLAAECGALGYHYARYLNSRRAEVLPAFLDLRSTGSSELLVQ